MGLKHQLHYKKTKTYHYTLNFWTFLLMLKQHKFKIQVKLCKKKINMVISVWEIITVLCSNSLICFRLCRYWLCCKTSPQNFNFLSWHPGPMLFKRDQQRPFNLQIVSEQAISPTMDSTLMTPFMRFNQRHLRNVSSHCQVLLGQVNKSSMPLFEQCQIQNTAFVSTSINSGCISLR